MTLWLGEHDVAAKVEGVSRNRCSQVPRRGRVIAVVRPQSARGCPSCLSSLAILEELLRAVRTPAIVRQALRRYSDIRGRSPIMSMLARDGNARLEA
jgi:hypothetical protein